MKKIILTLVLLTISAQAKSIKIFDNIETPKAQFSFVKSAKNSVMLLASVEYINCVESEDDDCTDNIYSKKLENFERVKREVFYTNSNGDKISCGLTTAMFQNSVIDGACSVEIKKINICVDYYAPNDCVSYRSKYEVYLNINE